MVIKMIKVIGYVNCVMGMVYFVTKEENIVEEIKKALKIFEDSELNQLMEDAIIHGCINISTHICEKYKKDFSAILKTLEEFRTKHRLEEFTMDGYETDDIVINIYTE